MNRQLRRKEAKQKSKHSAAPNPQLASTIAAIETLFGHGRLDEAADATLNAIQNTGRRHELYRCLGVIRQAQERYTEAMEAYRTATVIAPDYLPAHVNLAVCARELKQPDAALEALDAAVRIDPNSLHTRYNRALVYCDLKRLDEALSELRAAVKIKPDFADAHFQLAFLLELMEDYEPAIEHYRQAVLHKPAASEIEFSYGACLQVMGRFEEAADHLGKAASIRPTNGRAHYMLAYSDQADSSEAVRRKVSDLADRIDIAAEDRTFLNFAAARLHEKARDFETAFTHYETGNRIRRQSLSFDRDRTRALPARIADSFDETFFARHAGGGNASEQPVFVVGMPRSGTTLVEQIIASHPRAYGAGELSNMERMIYTSVHAAGERAADPEVIARWEPDRFSELAEEYLSDYRDDAPDVSRVADKTPGNAFLLGVLAVMFPNARFVCLDRDPMDTCWSIYCHNFLTNLQYACDFDDIAVYHRANGAVMEHWRKVLGSRILDLRYEDLVAAPEAAIRGLLAHCDLAWDERCLRPHETERGVHTASLWQVRKPIFDTSIGRWRTYERFLQPLSDALDREVSGPK